MGCYVDPKGEEKEAFLEREGVRLDDVPDWDTLPEGYLPVCLIQNQNLLGTFTAAGIGWDRLELSRFNLSHDKRPKRWYIVPIDRLWAVSDLWEYALEAGIPRPHKP